MLKLQLTARKHDVITFNNGKARGVVETSDGFEYRAAEFRFADQSKHIGVVCICPQDSGEHYATGIYLPDENDVVFQEDKEFLTRLGLDEKQVYPYAYRYQGHGTIRDHHINDDGWSR